MASDSQLIRGATDVSISGLWRRRATLQIASQQLVDQRSEGGGRMASVLRKNALISLLLISLSLVIVAGLEVESIGDEGSELLREILRDEAVERINQLAKISDADGYLERTFLSLASRKAAELIIKWMQDAGLRTWVDQIGNIHGRIEGVNRTEETLLIGSHYDTVVDAGRFDGSLGIISAISALKVLKISGKLLKLKRPIEVSVSFFVVCS
ncbi:allantoate deiminase 1-like [Curcuma longa]|uniref:allantoate deiminase 1-like n=1 Tax=Curcuma longa TaxID=136217 RepID=UPI003D9E2BBE